MFKFGFELEGFLLNTTGGLVVPDPATYDTDGFPGLVEVRTTGGKSLEEAYFSLMPKVGVYTSNGVSFNKYKGVFSCEDLVKIRKIGYSKEPMTIRNVYGKSPRYLGNKTLASFQINVSLTSDYQYIDRDGRSKTIVRNDMFDFVEMVRRFDEEFSEEIKESNRQPGFYALKDNCRVEYRSLPNSVFQPGLVAATSLLARIRKCVTDDLC